MTNCSRSSLLTSMSQKSIEGLFPRLDIFAWRDKTFLRESRFRGSPPDEIRSTRLEIFRSREQVKRSNRMCPIDDLHRGCFGLLLLDHVRWITHCWDTGSGFVVVTSVWCCFLREQVEIGEVQVRLGIGESIMFRIWLQRPRDLSSLSLWKEWLFSDT